VAGLQKYPDSVRLLMEYHYLSVVSNRNEEAASSLLVSFSKPSNHLALDHFLELLQPHLEGEGMGMKKGVEYSRGPWPTTDLFRFYSLQTKVSILLACAQHALRSHNHLSLASSLFILLLLWSPNSPFWLRAAQLSLKVIAQEREEHPKLLMEPQDEILPFITFIVSKCVWKLLSAENIESLGGVSGELEGVEKTIRECYKLSSEYYVVNAKWLLLYQLLHLYCKSSSFDSLFSNQTLPEANTYLPSVPPILSLQNRNFYLDQLTIFCENTSKEGKTVSRELEEKAFEVILVVFLHSAHLYCSSCVLSSTHHPLFCTDHSLPSSIILLSRPCVLDFLPQTNSDFELPPFMNQAIRNLHLVDRSVQLLKQYFTLQLAEIFRDWNLSQAMNLQFCLADISLHGDLDGAVKTYKTVEKERLISNEIEWKEKRNEKNLENKNKIFISTQTLPFKLRLDLYQCSSYLRKGQNFKEVELKLLQTLERYICSSGNTMSQSIIANFNNSCFILPGTQRDGFFFMTLSGICSAAIQSLIYLVHLYERRAMYGEMIVIFQFGWPFFRRKFKSFLSSKHFKCGFTYPDFFKYIYNVDILEWFAYTLQQQSINCNNGNEVVEISLGGVCDKSEKMTKQEICVQSASMLESHLLHTTNDQTTKIFHSLTSFIRHQLSVCTNSNKSD